MRSKRIFHDRAVFRTLEILRRYRIKRSDIDQVCFGNNKWTMKQFMNEVAIDEADLDQLQLQAQTSNSSLIINFSGYSKENGWKTFELIETRH